jgi:hypothetical protein
MYNVINSEEILFHNNEMSKCTGCRTIMIGNSILHREIVEELGGGDRDR